MQLRARVAHARRTGAAQQIDDVEPVLAAKPEHGDAVGVRATVVEAFSLPIDRTTFARGAGDFACEPAAQRGVRGVDHTIVVQKFEIAETVPGGGRDLTPRKTRGDLIVQGFELFGESVNGSESGKAGQALLVGLDDEHIEPLARSICGKLLE